MAFFSNYQYVRLGEVCDINPRLPSSTILEDETRVSFVPMSSVDEIHGEILEKQERAYGEIKKGFTPFQVNDVLFAKITPSMENGKAAIARDLADGVGFGSTEFHVIRCSDQVIPEFVFYFIRQASFRARAKSSFVGSAGQQRVPADFLARSPFPLPTIPEQRYIVEILEKAHDLRLQRLKIIEELKEIPSLLFWEMFGNPRDYAERWGTKKFGDFVSYSKYGPRFPDREYSEIGARILRTTDMEGDGSLRWWESPSMELSIDELEQHCLQPGTLLISRSGTIGPVALFSGSEEPCVAGAYLIEFGLSEAINHQFLTSFLLSAYGQALLTGGSQSMTQANLNAPTIKKIPVPTPPCELQDKFAGIVDEIKKLTVFQEQESQKLEDLINVLTASAFTGQLTQGWREEHQEEIEAWLKENGGYLPKKSTRILSKKTERMKETKLGHSSRSWIIAQLSKSQAAVYRALDNWEGVLIASENLDRFVEEWMVDDQVEDAQEQVRRALNQLAGLGLIKQVSLPNQNGEYVAGYRTIRQGELTKADDLKRLGANA
ncbi:restriction endonuclease subunit S [Halomicronema sp. CCY15110]|uniref:restriction endonuclease subunit S n=1 Tax=Halomicronema sp. CCY15110 TaxID=2767773 RepID=UPI00194EB23B|nr:restriction endonuclease subunit S [Halomicronema sp. CCY15110]